MSEGLFDDLESIPHDEVEEKSSDLNRQLRSLEDEFNSLRHVRRFPYKRIGILQSSLKSIILSYLPSYHVVAHLGSHRVFASLSCWSDLAFAFHLVIL